MDAALNFVFSSYPHIPIVAQKYTRAILYSEVI